MQNVLYEEIDRMKVINGELLEACKAAETHYAMLCEVLCKDNPPPGGHPVLTQLRAAIQNAEVEP